MYVALGTTSEGLRMRSPAGRGGCATCRPVLDVTEEYVERED
jgi:hypothetical protein